MPSSSRSLLGYTLLSAVAAGACSTEQLPTDRSKVMLVGSAIPENDSGAGIFLIRDDAYDPSSLTPRNLPAYGVTVDGRIAAWDETAFVLVGSNASVGFRLPAGSHVISLVDGQGRVAVTSPPMDTRPGLDPAIVFTPWDIFSPAVVFFGGPTSLQARVLVDDPTLVPAGSVHVRLMNALADHQPIQAVQCPTDVDGSTPYTAGACTPVGEPIAYGAVFEWDAAPDAAARLGYYWAAPDAVDPVVISIRGWRTTAGGYLTVIPTQVQGPGHDCPSCIFTQF